VKNPRLSSSINLKSDRLLDMRETGLGASPAQTLLEQAGVALSDGAAFGCPGFVRLNFGTTASQLEAALSRMDTLLKA